MSHRPRLRFNASLVMSFRLLLTLVAVVCCAGIAHAAEASRQVTELVEQLGADEFIVREHAEKELRAMGEPALDSLLEARAKHADGEVRRRAERLIPEIELAAHDQRLKKFLTDNRAADHLSIPGWRRMFALVGDSPEIRAWFVSMHRAEPTLMLRADERADLAAATLHDRISDLVKPQQRGQLPAMYRLSAAGIVALMFLGSRDDLSLGDPVTNQIASVAQAPAMSSLFASSNDPVGVRIGGAVVAQWIANRSQGWTSVVNLNLAQRYKLKEAGAALCRDMIGRGGLNASVRGQALLMLEQFGTKQDVALAESCLNDAGVCVNFNQGPNKKATIEVREVALAVAALLAGEKPETYGCGEIQRAGGQQLTLNSLDFGDTAKIDEAISKWRQRPPAAMGAEPKDKDAPKDRDAPKDKDAPKQ